MCHSCQGSGWVTEIRQSNPGEPYRRVSGVCWCATGQALASKFNAQRVDDLARRGREEDYLYGAR